ncbi:MAG: nucleotidyltransferase [Carnobacterium sp.]|uniref:tRNA(Met) cytidine acetate ligase n=1 Tax=Carnobacterium antarcticum TaxID=2126436 RepID=A0ABW4NPH6_9LACT|nr:MULTISPECIES: nucleotidyltransferase [unclassified Carnobacterium]ALV20711.1 UPF0348 protein [Carnobacterium sp. CP1]QQP70941.1 nucleotidyltransferase [Carnobacterium sp. CS13]
MKSCGVIVEYNPFHNGHLYHLHQAKEQTKADVLIAVMSGNFLQRGEPAIVDKWTRTQMALSAGADMVIELPVAFSVQPADYFAKGAVALLHSLGCEHLCFGAETGDAQEYQAVAEFFVKESEQIEERFKELQNNGTTYAAQMQQVLSELLPAQALDQTTPNNILGLAYAKENAKYAHPMTLHTVKREGAGYHDQEVSSKEFASATAIRRKLIDSPLRLEALTELAEVMPENSREALKTAAFLSWENFWPYLKYQLTIQSVAELRTVYQMTEGIEYRLKEKVKEAETFEHFISLVKNKRYTWVRLQRLCVYLLLDVKAEEMMKELQFPKALHILGFSHEGQQYLNQMKKKASLPLLTNIQQKNACLWKLDIKAGEVYNLAFSYPADSQDYRRQPIRWKKD